MSKTQDARERKKPGYLRALPLTAVIKASILSRTTCPTCKRVAGEFCTREGNSRPRTTLHPARVRLYGDLYLTQETWDGTPEDSRND